MAHKMGKKKKGDKLKKELLERTAEWLATAQGWIVQGELTWAADCIRSAQKLLEAAKEL